MVIRRSDQDGRGAGLPGMSREPRDRATTSWRRHKFGNERRIVSARQLLWQNTHRGMHKRAAGAERAAGAIAIVARRRVVAIMGAGMRAVKRTGNARLPSIDAYERKAGGLGGSAGNHGVRGKTRRVPVLCRHPYLRKASEENEPTADTPRAASGEASYPTIMQSRCSHVIAPFDSMVTTYCQLKISDSRRKKAIN
jgi:hypothetical protein